MSFQRLVALALVLAGSALPCSAGVVGKALPAVALEGYAQTPAKSFDDFQGRAVLIEFFAYW